MFRDLGRSRRFAVAAAALAAALSASGAFGQDRVVPDTYTATTTAMTPAGVALKIDVTEWSDESARADVASTLAGTQEDVSGALAGLPTRGVVWIEGSAAGYAIKYAHREAAGGSAERITLVTDRAVGSYSYRPWTAERSNAEETYEYSVIELRLGEGEAGVGTMSLAADVDVDAQTGTVTLRAGDAAPVLLSDVTLEPKPYWARGN